jgi:RNA polymerase sigma-70 factor, ECF subfamily
VRALAVARRPTSAPDGVLVQEAAAGGGESYAALYDRYSEQVYNYSLRLTGSPEDAADATQEAFINVLRRLQDDDRPVLDFSSYLFAAARNESYALMRRRSRTHPTEEPPELAALALAPDLETDPERAVLLQDSQEQVRQANAQLAPRHREVLALREVAGRSYDEIGQIMGVSENAAAQLIWRARGKLKEALTAGAVASVVAATADCETAQLLLNRIHDGEPITDEEQEWLDEHLEECASCRATRGLIFEVGASYRAWAPVAVLAAMRPEVLTQAGHVVGADWSGVAGKAGVSHGAVGGAATGVAVLAAAGIAISGLLNDDAQIAREAAPAVQSPPASEPAKAKAKPKRAKPPPVKAASARAAKTAAAPATPAERLVRAARPGAPGPPGTSPPGPRAEQPAPRAEQPAPRAEQPAPRVEQPAPPPQPRSEPRPVIAPPQQTAPQPAASVCTFPGNGGPDGCPPGHGGIPPGHGGTPPGQVGKS